MFSVRVHKYVVTGLRALLVGGLVACASACASQSSPANTAVSSGAQGSSQPATIRPAQKGSTAWLLGPNDVPAGFRSAGSVFGDPAEWTKESREYPNELSRIVSVGTDCKAQTEPVAAQAVGMAIFAGAGQDTITETVMVLADSARAGEFVSGLRRALDAAPSCNGIVPADPTSHKLVGTQPACSMGDSCVAMVTDGNSAEFSNGTSGASSRLVTYAVASANLVVEVFVETSSRAGTQPPDAAALAQTAVARTRQG